VRIVRFFITAAFAALACGSDFLDASISNDLITAKLYPDADRGPASSSVN
jgi:hypothetical protein